MHSMMASSAWRHALALYGASETGCWCYAELLEGLEQQQVEHGEVLWHLGDTVQRRASIEVRLRKNKRIWADAAGCKGF